MGVLDNVGNGCTGLLVDYSVFSPLNLMSYRTLFFFFFNLAPPQLEQKLHEGKDLVSLSPNTKVVPDAK